MASKSSPAEKHGFNYYVCSKDEQGKPFVFGFARQIESARHIRDGFPETYIVDSEGRKIT